MFDKDSITIEDIKSENIPSLKYINASDTYKTDFDKYTPKVDLLSQIIKWLEEHDEKLTAYAFGASWCKDCVIQLPRFIKISHLVGDRFTTGVFSGIKVKPPYDREKGKVFWKVPPSPPESIDTRLDMFHIPAIFLFTKNGKCIGKIDEKPEHTSTLEGDIWHYLKDL